MDQNAGRGSKERCFDRVFLSSLLVTTCFTFFKAATDWQWSSDDPAWDHIATVPRTWGNYWALLGPFVVLLVWSVSRRFLFGPPESDDAP